jgi:hypothetical protein
MRSRETFESIMKERALTATVSELARVNGKNSKDLIGNGQNGRVLKSDVEESKHPFSPQ